MYMGRSSFTTPRAWKGKEGIKKTGGEKGGEVPKDANNVVITG